MASFIANKSCVLAVTIVCMSVSLFHLGKADGDEYEDLPETGTGTGTGTITDTSIGAGTGTVVGDDPAEIVAKALLCFNDKYIYSSCEESYRLTASGNLDVPLEYTEEYCAGPCLSETQLVLNCIENIMKHFLFYNRATIQDIRDTIHAGCSYGPERGHFNVEEHIEAEENSSKRTSKSILFGIGSMFIGLAPLL